MNRLVRGRAVGGAVAALMLTTGAAVLAGGAAAQAATGYVWQDLGIRPTAISDTGKILGSLTRVWENGTLTDIHQFGAIGILSSGLDINSSGQVVGFGANSGGPSFIRNADGSYANVGPTSDPLRIPGAGTAINDAGQSTGRMAIPSCAGGSGAFFGSATMPTSVDLGNLGGWFTTPADINDNAQIVGSASIPTPGQVCPLRPSYHAWYWSAATGIRDLHQPSMLGTESAAYKINNLGLAVGNFANGLTFADNSTNPPGTFPVRHAVIWDVAANTYHDYGNAALDSSFLAINDAGTAVGYEREMLATPPCGLSFCGPNYRNETAMIKEPTSATMVKLAPLVQGLPAGWRISRAMDINRGGQIIATAFEPTGIEHGLLLTPAGGGVVTLPPTAPSNVVASAVASNVINLSWGINQSNQTAQTVERCQGVGCTNFVTIATLATNIAFYSDPNLVGGTSYSYRVVAVNAVGSSPSAVATAVTFPPIDTTVPKAPSNLTGSGAPATSTVRLKWADNSTNEDTFVLERCTGRSCTRFGVLAYLPSNTTTFTDTGALRGSQYRYRVRATNANGSSGSSNTVTVRQ